jgi:hypothetical protein
VGRDWAVDEVLGRARLEVTPADADSELFVGIARTSDAIGYLRGVGYSGLDELRFRSDGGQTAGGRIIERAGGPPAQPPGQAGLWVAPRPAQAPAH